MLFGAHVHAAHPLAEAAARGADVIQMFLGNPQSWKKPKPREDAAELAAADIDIYVHAPYLVNVVAGNNRVRIPSRKILQQTCDAAAAVGAKAVIVHGGHITGDDGDEGEGFVRWRKALEQTETDLLILIENTAGGDVAMAREVDVIGRLWEHIGDLDVGFCLDTCHAWAGGQKLEGLVERILAATGRIDLVHCNDSRDEFDSRRDRHANLGDGLIDEAALVEVVRAAGAPVVLETPGEAADHVADLEWLKARL